MTPAEEQAYERGERAAWTRIFTEAARALGHTGKDNAAALLIEREAIVAALRIVCAEHGSNEWEAGDHLGDVIEKRLGRYLDAKEPE